MRTITDRGGLSTKGKNVPPTIESFKVPYVSQSRSECVFSTKRRGWTDNCEGTNQKRGIEVSKNFVDRKGVRVKSG